MKLEELLEKPQNPSAQKEPTFAQYQELVNTLRQSNAQLQQEKTQLTEQLQQASEEKKRQAQRISQLEKDLADQQLEGDDNTPQKEPPESTLPEEAQPTDPRIAYWKQKLHHPAAPIVIWGVLTGLSLLSSTIRADFVQLGQTLKAAMCTLNDCAAELTANLSYVIADKKRIYDPALAGGALLDIGVYGLNFALMHFGNDIVRVESSVTKMDTGVDGMETITLHYRDGRMAVLTHSVYCRSDRMGIIHGDKGYLVVENINNPQSIRVFDTADRLLARYDVPEQVNGYEYEFRETALCIGEGKLEADSMPHADTIEVMEMMDNLRKAWDVVYPQEQ